MEILNPLRDHSALPWEADAENLCVVDAYGNVVADCETETFDLEKCANARLIAEACSNYHAVYQALVRLLEVSFVIHKTCNPSIARDDVKNELKRAIQVGQAAIADTTAPHEENRSLMTPLKQYL
jgi:hypothetical protein